MIVCDANIYVGYFLKNDVHHTASIEILDKKRIVYLPELIYAEVITLLTYKAGYEVGEEFINMIEIDDRIRLISSDIDKVSLLRKRVKKRVSYQDIALIQIAIEYGLEIYSFDKQLISIHRQLQK